MAQVSRVCKGKFEVRLMGHVLDNGSKINSHCVPAQVIELASIEYTIA